MGKWLSRIWAKLGDCKLNRLLECGREKQPYKMGPLEEVSAGQSTGMAPC